MNLKSSVLLLATCISAIGAVGCVFELAYGTPKFGFAANWVLLTLSLPLTAGLFLAAVKEARANLSE
jgi:hypothetical protein